MSRVNRRRLVLPAALLLFLAFLAAVVAHAPLRVRGAEISGQCGEEVTWSLSESGTLTLAGNGATSEFSQDLTPWAGARARITRVVVEEGVTEIGSFAFSGCPALERASLPATLVRIGTGAFRDCPAFARVDLPAAKIIGSSAFYGCTSLEEIALPEGTERIEAAAFFRCANLCKVTLPQSLLRIGERAFAGCESLTSLELPPNLESVGEGVSADCAALSSLTMRGEGENYFVSGGCLIYRASGAMVAGCAGCTPPSDGALRSVAAYALAGNAKLKAISLPASTEKVGAHAFENCSLLEKVQIPASAIIGLDAFRGCPPLQVVLTGGAGGVIVRYAFSGCDAFSRVAISPGVRTIESFAFHNCKNLKELDLPGSIAHVEEDAFQGCGALTTVTYRGTRAQWEKVELDDTSAAFREPQFLPAGDLNGDGVLNIADVAALLRYLSSPDIALFPDIDGSGKISAKDVTRLLTMLQESM